MRYFLIVLASIGAILSSITLWIHFAVYHPETIVKAPWNSGFVGHSSYAVVRGVPVALIGLAGYALVGILVWFRHRTLTTIASFLGLAFALYLTNIEAHILNIWCAYCVASLVVMVMITIVALIQFVFWKDTVDA